MAEFLPLRRRAQRWADDNVMRLRGADPAVPEVLNDRQQDNARAICAIADIAGADWPATIRGALIGLAQQTDDEPQSAGVLLLRDISELLETRKGDGIGSADLCEALCALEESPWAEWRRGFAYHHARHCPPAETVRYSPHPRQIRPVLSPARF